MDRSFQSRPEVIAAAKKFVFIRLPPEDQAEKKFVSKIVNGEPANNTFAMLTPEGERKLRGRGPGRGPRDLYKDAADMAKGLDELAEKYPPKKAEGTPALPVTFNAKVGLDVAAGDLQPLVVVLADSARRREELEVKVAELAWDKAIAGRLTYSLSASTKDVPMMDKLTIREGILLIKPDIFGAGGKVVKEIPGDEMGKQLADAMRETLKAHVYIVKNWRTLAALGLKEGIFSEISIPVSEKGEATDRERYKKLLDLKKKD